MSALAQENAPAPEKQPGDKQEQGAATLVQELGARLRTKEAYLETLNAYRALS